MNAKFCFVLLIGLLALCLVGCSSSKSKQAAQSQQLLPPVSRLEPVPSPQPAQPMAQSSQPVAQPVQQAMPRPMPQSVFFETNQSKITPHAEAALRDQAEWLKRNTGKKIEISGNTDQRAGNDYNLQLGQKRADAVKDQLVSLGVSPDRLQTTSYGKERPVCTDSTENCNAANRRVDLRTIG